MRESITALTDESSLYVIQCHISKKKVEITSKYEKGPTYELNNLYLEVNSIKEISGLTDGGDCSDNFSKLEFVKDGSLTSSIKTYHKNSHLLLGKKPAEQLCEGQPHSVSLRLWACPLALTH